MKTINLKKIFPGIISLIIILGMAIQSFATSVDMAAFVKKDKYMTKYYELDWRIKDIDTSLNRLYKWTCTNVRSLGGSYWSGSQQFSMSTMLALNTDSSGVTPMFYLNYAELSQDKYLRVGQADLLTFSADLYDSTKLGKTIVYEIPATFLEWPDGYELGENCKFKYTMTSTGRLQGNQTMEIIIGPIKKMPPITSTGASSGRLCQSYELIAPTSMTFDTFQYAVNTETQPTSWITDSGRVYQTYGERSSAASQIPQKLNFDSPYCRDKSSMTNWWYFSTVPTTVLASSTNIWLRISYITSTSTTHSSNYMNSANTSNCFVVTSWNNDK